MPSELNFFMTPSLILIQISLTVAVLPADYESRSAQAKQEVLWTQIQAEPHDPNSFPVEAPSKLQSALLVVPTHLRHAFTHVSDEMIEGRVKLLHTYGICAKAHLVMVPDSRYTGIFRTGVTGIVRPSIAKLSPTNFIPGMGFKALLDGKPSVNFHTLFSLDGQGANRNYFHNNMSSVISPPSSFAVALASKFFEMALILLPGGASKRPEDSNTMTVYEHASVERSGATVPASAVTAPYKIDFVPNKDLGYSESDSADFRTRIGAIAPGTRLYTMVAYGNKADADARQGGEIIGSMVTDSAFLASKYCDEKLHFKHATQPWKQ
ncbi:hypothetical protein BV898_18016 [Hypsibius exemplaris]|uniref:Uncharacterized protein n=1 Tax=Hypsibius exemplaris TaxID=2072580 RepID=A0A9X6NG26_HYPEX|nr:hypothetical protein BV898_18016 [Hypsibius exemplaris]